MKSQAKQLIATEKRILTPSGRLQQVAALVHRRDMGALKVLVITSRGTGRWIIPKGWPQVGRTLAETALREAYEEAGIRGEVSPIPIGSFATARRTFRRSASTSSWLRYLPCNSQVRKKTGQSGTNASASGYRRRKLHVVSKKVN